MFFVETSVQCQHSAEALSAAEITKRERGGRSREPGPGRGPAAKAGEARAGAASTDPALRRLAVGASRNASDCSFLE